MAWNCQDRKGHLVGILGRSAGKDLVEDPDLSPCSPECVRGHQPRRALVSAVQFRRARGHVHTVYLEASMKRLQVILTALVIVILAAVLCWRPAIATPNTGLTQEARTELAEALRH